MRLLALLLAFPLTAPAAKLQPREFFGCYRTQSYNGVENVYSGRFFAPSIHSEPSNKIKNLSGEFTTALNLDFEVPVQEDGGMALRFRFLEFPLDGSSAREQDGRLFLTNSQDFLVFQGRAADGSERYQLCHGDRTLALARDGEKLQADLTIQSRSPECASEEHHIVGTKVDLNCE